MGRIIYSDKSGTKVMLEMPDTHQTIADLGLNPDGEVQAFITRRAAERMDKYVPFRTGVLRMTVDYKTDPTQVEYVQEYARPMYFGVSAAGVPLNYNGAPQRGSFWDEKMMAAEGDQFFNEIQEFSDEFSKGRDT